MEACMEASCAAATTSASTFIFLQLVQSLLVAQCGLSDNYPPDRSEEIANSNIEFDFVIVGAGSAGSVIANRLTEVENWKVLLIEAGDDPSAVSEVPLLFPETLSTSEDYSYDAEPDELICQSSKNKVCKWRKGKALGGSTTINGMIYHYGNDEDYNEWSRMGNEGWSYEEVLPYFKKSQSCNYVHSDEREYCDHGGPMHIGYFNYTDTGIQKLFMSAARELNVPILNTVNGDKYIGYGIAPANVHEARKMNTARAFLSPIKNRSNFYVMKSTRADAVLLRGTQAIGVRVTLKNGRSIDVRASKEVILSAGTVASPQLLMLSGIGPKQHLLEMGIPSVVDLPVGKNLQNHVGWQGIYLTYKNETARPPSSTFISDEAYEYLMYKRGSLATSGGFDFVSFVNVYDSNSKYPDIQFFHVHYPQWNVDKLNVISKIFTMDDDMKHDIMKTLREVDIIAPMPSLLKPKSKGELRLRSTNPAIPVKIYAKCFSEQKNIETMLESLNFIKKVLKTETFVRQGVSLHHLDIPGCRHTESDSDEYWRCNLRHTSITYYHATGTAKMGPRSDPTAVVDARLRVHGVQGLRVVDASIMPTIISGTTMAPTIMIGEKGADLIKEDWADVGGKAD
ncbi:glucose dehydrogenase [FAD, quinone]-like [Odontomachus brunneus]|uniref:glucose dehydrogenase [FAD, quinone]-like n=1 Tax=Odontomachus brunneus TaxID=486640 RepID=UPI0013F1E071|nr:glucose dehydrogenase [FAD, quinone]-like [Odontomachus brunneus]XP_032663989.1 glucose dehydrogenase [FAD, quinone]-like [Odontomachus brunneus]